MFIKRKRFYFIWRGQPLRYLVFGLVKSGGRNNLGRICSFKKGGGCQRRYRIIDFKRNLLNIKGIVCRLEYDPNRTAYIALICYQNGIISYIIAVTSLFVGDTIINYSVQKRGYLIALAKIKLPPALTNANAIIYLGSGICLIPKSIPKVIPKFTPTVGSSFVLIDLEAGSLISNIEYYPGSGARLCCAAGASCTLQRHFVDRNLKRSIIRLPSGLDYIFDSTVRVVLGIVSNARYILRDFNKAGTSRKFGTRPTVRGVAMNPVDHPHGGGEGKKSPRRCSMSPWGKLCKGIKTRRNNKTNRYFWINLKTLSND